MFYWFWKGLQCSVAWGTVPKAVKVCCQFILYAYDLVIFSTSPEGLQNGLDNLDSYCQKWKLSVNLKECKSMCVSKQGHDTKARFTIGGNRVEPAKNFCYLGIELTNSGSFKLTEKCITDKARKVSFKLKSMLHRTRLTPNISLKCSIN